MKLNKDLQYSMLLVLYLCRSGRSTIKVIAQNLDISFHMLQQLSLKLLRGGVLTSAKGPGGGYEIKGDPTVLDVMRSIAPVGLLDATDGAKLRVGGVEARSLFQLTKSMNAALHVVLNRKVRNVGKELVANEMEALNRDSLSTMSN